MITYIRRQRHKNLQHQDMKHKEPPQKYRLGTISNKKYWRAPNNLLTPEQKKNTS